MRYNMVTSTEGRSTIVLITDDGDNRIITESDPAYVRVLETLLNGGDPTEWLTPTTDWFADQYAVATDDDFDDCDDCGNCDYCDCDDFEDDDYDFEPEEVIENLFQTIARYRREGRSVDNLVHFMRRLANNPSRRSREQLFSWTQAKDLTIDIDGYIVGYKGVRPRIAGTDDFPLERYPFQSQSAGHGIVDGVEISHGNLPMGVGAVVSIPREEVQDDPTIGCHVGLHVGTHSYADGFGPVLVEVRFDPADVVSVPVDCGFAKLRCCRYEVVAVHEIEEDDLSVYEPAASWDEFAAIDTIEDALPAGIFASLKARLKKKNR